MKKKKRGHEIKVVTFKLAKFCHGQENKEASLVHETLQSFSLSIFFCLKTRQNM